MFTILKPECCIGRSPSHHGEEKYQFYDCHKFNLISFLPHFLFVVCFRVEQERRSLIIPSGSSRRIKVDVFLSSSQNVRQRESRKNTSGNVFTMIRQILGNMKDIEAIM